MPRRLCCFLTKCVYLNFRKSVLQDGIFNQLRVDCSKKFNLCFVIQELFRELRNDHTISPYRQTQSKKVSTFVTIQWKVRSFQHFEKIYRTDLETLTWFWNLFVFCPASFDLKTWAKKIDLKNGRLSINGFPWLYLCLLEPYSWEDLVRGKCAC